MPPATTWCVLRNRVPVTFLSPMIIYTTRGNKGSELRPTDWRIDRLVDWSTTVTCESSSFSVSYFKLDSVLRVRRSTAVVRLQMRDNYIAGRNGLMCARTISDTRYAVRQLRSKHTIRVRRIKMRSYWESSCVITENKTACSSLTNRMHEQEEMLKEMLDTLACRMSLLSFVQWSIFAFFGCLQLISRYCVPCWVNTTLTAARLRNRRSKLPSRP